MIAVRRLLISTPHSVVPCTEPQTWPREQVLAVHDGRQGVQTIAVRQLREDWSAKVSMTARTDGCADLVVTIMGVSSPDARALMRGESVRG